MPNWCYNYATFSHEDKAQMDKLRDAIDKKEVLERKKGILVNPPAEIIAAEEVGCQLVFGDSRKLNSSSDILRRLQMASLKIGDTVQIRKNCWK
jgi:hypothetical protein